MAEDEAGYYRGLGRALKAAGVAWPVMVIDRDRLDANCDALAAIMPAEKALRIVAKSLPSPDLLAHVTGRLGTDRLMTFSVAMARQLHRALPEMRHLFGKPVPVAAIASLLHDGAETRALAESVVWLVDTGARLSQMQALAQSQGVVLRIALEIDVGLHRGGFGTNRDLAAGLAALKAAPSLTFAGMVGYEPHLPALPSAFGIRRRAEAAFRAEFGKAQAMAGDVFGAEAVAQSIRNTGGSKTLGARTGEDFANDLSLGSLLVKPTDFDGVAAPAMQPAAFIATPLLKTLDRFAIPGFGASRAMQMLFERGADRAVFIHGGHWLADPVFPPGLVHSKLVGRSSNQEILVSRGPVDAAVDDFVVLRPHQSEAVLLQFGPLVVVSHGDVAGTWEVFPPTA